MHVCSLLQGCAHLPNGTALDGDCLYNYDSSKDNLSQAGEWSLVHDHLGRLVGASASTLGNYSATYGYDAFNNNTSASVGGATPPQAIGFTFGALPLNQTPGTTMGGSATGWTYDAAGEATNFGSAPGSSSVTGLVWDGLGRMSQVNAPGLTEQEGYAPSGMRVRRDDSVAANSRRFVYTSGGLLLAEYVPRSGGGWQWNRDVVYLGSQAIAEINGAGTHESHSDHLGTPRVITTASGGTSVIEGRQNYGPYGETFPAMDSGYQPLTGYTGHVQTDPTGLIYMRGRFYTPSWHRFVNSDQGVDPSTWNQMAYVGGSPMMGTDPSGMIETLCNFPPGAKVTDLSTGKTYTADAHGCITAGGGGGVTVDVNGGASPDVLYWDNPPISFSPVDSIPTSGGGFYTPPPPKPPKCQHHWYDTKGWWGVGAYVGAQAESPIGAVQGSLGVINYSDGSLGGFASGGGLDPIVAMISNNYYAFALDAGVGGGLVVTNAQNARESQATRLPQTNYSGS